MTKEKDITDTKVSQTLSELELGQLSKTELELTKQEFALNKRELEFLKSQIDNSKKISPVTATIIVGLIAAIAAMFGNYWQGRVNADLEQKKFESALIQKTIESRDKIDQLRSLQFLVDIGLIKDAENKIKNIKPSDLPKLSASTPPVAPPVIQGAWGVALEEDATLEDAQDHLWSMAIANGFNNSYIFKRPEGYRTVVIFKTENEARAQIPKAKTINPTVNDEPKNLDVWCPKPQWNQELQYFECGQ